MGDKKMYEKDEEKDMNEERFEDDELDSALDELGLDD